MWRERTGMYGVVSTDSSDDTGPQSTYSVPHTVVNAALDGGVPLLRDLDS